MARITGIGNLLIPIFLIILIILLSIYPSSYRGGKCFLGGKERKGEGAGPPRGCWGYNIEMRLDNFN